MKRPADSALFLLKGSPFPLAEVREGITIVPREKDTVAIINNRSFLVRVRECSNTLLVSSRQKAHKLEKENKVVLLLELHPRKIRSEEFLFFFMRISLAEMKKLLGGSTAPGPETAREAVRERACVSGEELRRVERDLLAIEVPCGAAVHCFRLEDAFLHEVLLLLASIGATLAPGPPEEFDEIVLGVFPRPVLDFARRHYFSGSPPALSSAAVGRDLAVLLAKAAAEESGGCEEAWRAFSARWDEETLGSPVDVGAVRRSVEECAWLPRRTKALLLTRPEPRCCSPP